MPVGKHDKMWPTGMPADMPVGVSTVKPVGRNFANWQVNSPVGEVTSPVGNGTFYNFSILILSKSILCIPTNRTFL